MPINADKPHLWKADKISRGLAIVSLCIGIGLIMGCGFYMHHTHLDNFLLHSESVEGAVISNKQIRCRGSCYAAIVAFTDSTGHPITFQDPMAFGRPSFSVGQKVRVFYDPQHPQSAMVDRGMKNYIIPLICFAFAGFCIQAGVQRLSMSRRR
jgi:hypothetical protein